MASEEVGVSAGDVDGVAFGMTERLGGVGVTRMLVSGVVVDVAFAFGSKTLSIAAFSVSIFSGWAIETTIFPAGSMTYAVGMPLVLYEFVRLSPPVRTGHVIPVELTYVELIASAVAPVISTLRN
jgi:hypothetical protein